MKPKENQFKLVKVSILEQLKD